MKNLIIYCGLLTLGLTSCMEEEAPSAVLNVSLDKTEYLVGETVTFKLDGNPDNIIFYSGEFGHDYDERDREYVDNDLVVDVALSTSVIQPNLQILVSSDFNGVYDVENVKAATWTDVSNLFDYPDKANVITPGGAKNLSPYVSNDKDATLYVAFRYFYGGEHGNSYTRNGWFIKDIKMSQVSPVGDAMIMAEMTKQNVGWKTICMIPGAESKWSDKGNQVVTYGNSTTPPPAAWDDWLITKGFKVKEPAEPDFGVALKNLSTSMSEYQYVYKRAGMYKAVFVTSSEWYNGGNSALTEVMVEVKDKE